MPKLSAIVPIYNVAPYIERNLNSLLGQTLQDLELIFINDATTDNSIEILNKIIKNYPNRLNQIKIINNPENKGLAATRTVGIEYSSGDYIIHCDSDDYINETMYEVLYKRAVSSDADMVMCDYYYVDNDNLKRHKIPKFKDPRDYLFHWFDSDIDYSPVWNKLLKRELIFNNQIFPLEGLDNGEDIYCSSKYFYYAKKIEIVDRPLYYYCKNSNSISSQEINLFDFFKRKELIDNILSFFKDKPEFSLFCNNLKFNQKIRGYNLFKDNPNDWFYLYKDCHKDILKFKDNSFKARLFWKIALSSSWSYKSISKLLKGFKLNG